MRFVATPVDGAYVLAQERHSDERGFFARTFCAEEFTARGLDAAVAQTSVSRNRRRGTLRGLHYQVRPAAETKLVRCTRGAVWDVIVDLRPDSPTYGSHFGIELGADSGTSLYVPKRCAHGFQTLADDSEVAYQISAPFSPEHARGLRYDDPALGIEWPLPVSAIAEKDLHWPAFDRPAAAASRA
jgi:dTDP-4-dehydrorhamnose 3,5-epimerase